jgi:UDPglucose 6-dehydrogenase
VDNDEEKIEKLRRGESIIYEIGLEELMARNTKGGRLTFTTSLKEGVEKALAVFVAVGTPSQEDGSVYIDAVFDVVKEIAAYLDDYKVIITKSTVPPGTGRKIRSLIEQVLEEKRSPEYLASHPEATGRKPSFDVVSNPEFLREGSSIEDFMRPNRVVVGAERDEAVAIMKEIYRPLYLLETPMVITDLETAELIKYASNCFLATKISFINEMSRLCELFGADVSTVARGIGLDKRIGPKFLHVSPGYGGACFPKDTQGLVHIAKEAGYDLKIVKATEEVNEEQKSLMVGKIRDVLGDLHGKSIAILGLAFKPNTDDIRKSASIAIIEQLKREGAEIRAFDPVAMSKARESIRGVEYGKGIYDTVDGADALVILTEWNEFRQLNLMRIKDILKAPNFIDLRNIYEPERMRRIGFNYVSIGRPDQVD